ncbi:pyridine nucleotide-disulfide oxidoreductase [Pseudomonas viridiflava]|uniref:pyridine nucleotide-disulfide oxidoreductase n=1 Tax=Pseudomonas viridiflava TaxID=33069 RepID=UPI000F0370BE|nr:pyridine nucleotide-disulfide oxidoreductase [Pseudomonas viridiflava]QXG34710.1 lysine N(6)-hydroxylase/L-ornithine N(5)-oxygenase family protein [Pseudomonas viridiflava]QXG42929.1 lysine N(6)-hydroxylase/L-ornithine N(5)-oxygenase family protein [Pseudomonas viridiflava]
MFEKSLETVCGCVVGGAGLAGMGFLFNALKSGTLAEITASGLMVIDASDRPGTGALGQYRITANSVGDVFIDCLRDPALREIFEPLEYSPAYWRIRGQAQSAPQLSDVGQLMVEASRLVLEHLTRCYGVKVWHGTTITEVISEDDEFCLKVETEGCARLVRCQTLVLNLGGRQDPQHLIDSLAQQGLSLSPATNIQSADRLLRMNAVQLREVFALALASGGRITVVGGSHSAFSMLENLADALEFAGLEELTLIHRTRIRLFYESAEQADAAGYVFDSQLDVCPVSGRINRSGGLRYRALDIGREALKHGRIGKTGVRVQLLQTSDGPAGAFEKARLALAESCVVVQCSGYQPQLPVMRHGDGSLITLRETKGGLDSDQAGCPMDQNGRRLKGLYLFGLGAGLGADPQLGSEPSFDGRIYGVWQFHHDASRVVIQAVMARLQQKASAVDTSCLAGFLQLEPRFQA